MGGSSCEETQCRGECLQALYARTYKYDKWTSVVPLIGHPELRLIRAFVNYTLSSPNFTIFLPKCGHLANQDLTSVFVRVIPLSTISNQSCEPLANNCTHTHFAACFVIKCSLLVSRYLGYLTEERSFQSVKVGMSMVKETADCFKPVFCSCSVDMSVNLSAIMGFALCRSLSVLRCDGQPNKQILCYALVQAAKCVSVCMCVSPCACVCVSVCYVCVCNVFFFFTCKNIFP